MQSTFLTHGVEAASDGGHVMRSQARQLGRIESLRVGMYVRRVAKRYRNHTIYATQHYILCRSILTHMCIRWDEAKRQEVQQRRQIDFAFLQDLLSLPYVEDQRNDDPEQYRIIGCVRGRLVTFIAEYRQDAIGEYMWVVTAWHATSQEQQVYEREVQ
jgi:uncharacterized DUF497 family protein